VARVDALLSLMKQRLAIAQDVARAKWSARRPIDDPSREQQVVDDAATSARDYALDPRSAAAFFRGQIEASKVVQRHLFAEWTAASQPAFESGADLAKDVRLKLDRLTPALLRALSDALPVLTRPGGKQLLLARGRAALADAPGGDAAIRAALAPLESVGKQRAVTSREGR
jgi:chorismate mutase